MSVPVTCDVFVMPPPSREASQALQRHLCLVTGVTGSEGEASNVVTDADISPYNLHINRRGGRKFRVSYL